MFHYNREYDYYYEYHKLSNGQTALFALNQWRYSKHRDLYVVFAIADKKKQLIQWMLEEGNGDLDSKVTGKCGTEGLAWAYRKIKEAIEYFKKEDSAWHYNLIVSASDHRRFVVYEHFLKRLGFTKCNVQGSGLVLLKKI